MGEEGEKGDHFSLHYGVDSREKRSPKSKSMTMNRK